MRFGSIEVRPAERQLLLEGRAVSLGARAYDLLLALVERRDRVVTKDELLNIVWPGLVVEENNLQVQVSALRKVLGADAISTIPGRGYRFTLRGSDESDQVLQQLARTERAAARPPIGNVPIALDAPIGRSAELAEFRELLPRHRLVSITGAGGIGKTTVGLAVADALRAHFAGGVWWVELAPLADAGLVAETIARTLGVQLAPGRRPPEALAAAVHDMNSLVVLDNCEHLIDAVTSVVDAVLARVSSVRFLVTSQEPLRTQHEYVFRLSPLTTPAADAALTVPTAADFSAVRLFVERAKAADRRFELTSFNVDAIAEICRRLDGIPLAIELAAARIPLMGAEGLRQRLGERFRVLTAGARSVMRRHQTLLATLEWSHGLLSVDEQAVFRRLGVCAGGTSLPMAQAIAADGALDDWAVLTALGALVDRSLIVADGGDEPRYRLLETTRAFALQQLAAADETAKWLRRHAEVVLDVLHKRAQGRWYNERDPEIVAELDNVRAALDWALGTDGDAAMAAELAGQSSFVWWSTASLAEGAAHAKAAAERISDTTPREVRARLWLTYAALGVFTTRPDCFDAAQRAVELCGELRDPEALYQALVVRAGIGARRGEFAAARAALDLIKTVEDSNWSPRRRSSGAFAEWIVASWEGRYADAKAHALRQAELNRAGGNNVGEQLALGNVASCDVALGQPAAAVTQLRGVIAELERIGAAAAGGHMRYTLARALLELGEVHPAVIEAREAYALLRREGDQGIMLPLLARLAAAGGQLEAAVKIAGYTHAFWRDRGIRPRFGLSAEELAPSLTSTHRHALLGEGASLVEEQVFALVFS